MCVCVCVCVLCVFASFIRFTVMYSACTVHVFAQTNDRRKKEKKEYAIHYVKEGPKVDNTCKEAQSAITTGLEYVAGDCIATLCLLLIDVCSHDSQWVLLTV